MIINGRRKSANVIDLRRVENNVLGVQRYTGRGTSFGRDKISKIPYSAQTELAAEYVYFNRLSPRKLAQLKRAMSKLKR
jgi:hypothetical protein